SSKCSIAGTLSTIRRLQCWCRSLFAGALGAQEGKAMSVAEKVTAHLPYLRRFARSVTGSQKSGDAYVVSTLEAMLADPTIFPGDLEPRVALYRTFLKILNSIEWNTDKARNTALPGLEAAHRNLDVMTPPA